MNSYKKLILKGLLLSSSIFLTNVTYAQANAQNQASSVIPYNGATIDKIKKNGTIIIGTRSSSIPLSYFDNNKNPMGYGVDVCLALIDNIKKDYNLPNLKVSYQEVTGSNRIPLTIDGSVDLECGSTTNNETRRKDVDFTIPYYISGVRILTKKNTGVVSLNDLRGKKIALGAGTTSIPLMEKINKERAMNMTLIVEPSFSEALSAVNTGKADAFVLDDLLLFGERSKVSNPQDFDVVGEFLSVEPLAIMIRKNDPEFKNYLNKKLNQFIQDGTIDRLYSKWFENPIPPNNQNLNIPQTPLLKDVFRMPTDIVGN